MLGGFDLPCFSTLFLAWLDASDRNVINGTSRHQSEKKKNPYPFRAQQHLSALRLIRSKLEPARGRPGRVTSYHHEEQEWRAH
jgi:hypothetical protein